MITPRFSDRSVPLADAGVAPVKGHPSSPWPGLAAVVLLAGSVRPSPLRRLSGRFGLELPISERQIVKDHWVEHLTHMVEATGMPRLAVRIMVDRLAGLSVINSRCDALAISVEQDPSALRGTGGLLHDLAKPYDDDASMLVCHASQVMFRPLAEQVAAMAALGADVAIACDADGAPAGLMLLRCRCLRQINKVGFVDLNEQALPEMAKVFDVRVVRDASRPTESVRTRASYVAALRRLYRPSEVEVFSPLEAIGDWRPVFALIEPGSHVDSGAIIHDSVVLGGARVEQGAAVVRSVVCPGAVVARGTVVVDQVVAGLEAGQRVGRD